MEPTFLDSAVVALVIVGAMCIVFAVVGAIGEGVLWLYEHGRTRR